MATNASVECACHFDLARSDAALSAATNMSQKLEKEEKERRVKEITAASVPWLCSPTLAYPPAPPGLYLSG